MTELKDQLSLLGRKTEYRQDYAPEVLEAFDNKHPGNDYWVRFNCPEFPSLCPITGLCRNPYLLYPRCQDGREQEFETLLVQLPQSWCFPRGLREHHNERPHSFDEP